MKQIYLVTSGIAGSLSGTVIAQKKPWQNSGAALTSVNSFFKEKLPGNLMPLMVAMLFLLTTTFVQAQTKTWLPSTGGSWITPANWSTGTIPVTGDDVIIGTQTGNITAIPTISLNSLTITGNCTLEPPGSRGLVVTGTLTIATGATLSVGTVSSPNLNLTLAAGATGFINGTGTVAINSSLTTAYFNCRGSLTIDAGALVTGNSNFRIYNTGTLIIANTSGITQTGASGAIQVTGIRNYRAGASYVYNGSAAQVTGDGLTFNNPANLTINNSSGVTLSSTTTITRLLTMTSGTLNMAGYNLTVGSLTGTSNITGTSGSLTLTVGSDNTTPAAYSGVISDGTATSVAVTKNGSGTITLAGANSYSGLTTVSSGTLKLGASGDATNTPLGTTGSETIVSSGASLDLNGFTLGTAEALNLHGTGISGGGALTNSSPTGVSYSGLITLGSASSIVTNPGDINITNSGTITGATFRLTLGGSGNGIITSIIGTTSGTVVKNGTGTWTLSGANTYSGLTTVSAGTLKLGAAGNVTNTPLGTTGGRTTVTSGAALDLNGYTLGTAEDITLNGTGISGGGALINSSATSAGYIGDITLASASSIGTTGNISSTGVISGAASLTKVGTGTLILSGNNTFSGGLTIDGGIVQIGASDRIATQAVTLNGGTFSTGATTGYNETVGTLALTENSTISLGSGVHTLNFANSSAIGWTSGKLLTITGWKGTTGAGTPGTEGRILFGSAAGLTGTQLGQIQFLVGGSYYTASILPSGEVIPFAFISITTGTISGSPFCAGSAVSVPFTITGTFISGNVFTAQLSDATGGWGAPADIGTLNQTTEGTIAATIPINTATGSGYRIRVISSTPPVTGSINGADLAVTATLTAVNVTPNTAQNICITGAGTQLTVSETGGGAVTRQWGKRSVSGGAIADLPGETGVTYIPSGAGLGSGTSYVVCTSVPACGTPTVSNEVTITVTAAGTWLGWTTDWNSASNWCGGIPTSSTDATILSLPSNQPVISGTITAECNNLTINSGASLTIDPTGRATITSITNNGTLRLNSSSTAIASLKLTTYIDNGTEEIQLYLPNNRWQYISSYVYSLSSNIFTTDLSPVNNNFAQYVESEVTTSQNTGWVAYDGYKYGPPVGTGGPTFSSLTLGKGYNFKYNTASPITLTFGGTINTTNKNIGLDYNSHSPANSPADNSVLGWNLLGNPFSSSLDWSIIRDGLDPSIGSAIYFTLGNGSFASWNGVGTPSGTEGKIPPMQGFFVKTNAVSTSVTLSAGATVHSLQNRYKGNSIIPLVRLKIEDQANTDDAVVRFEDKATPDFDNAFDAYKFSKSGGPVSIWTTLGNVDYSINGITFPETSIEIPVGIYSLAAGSLKISGSQIDGLENYNVTLKDKLRNITIDLKSSSYLSFDAPAGIVSDRFVLKISNMATPIAEEKISDTPFNIYYSMEILNVQTLGESWNGKKGDIKVTDISGRLVTTESNIVFSKDAILKIPTSTSKGILLVEIRSGAMRYVGKVSVK